MKTELKIYTVEEICDGFEYNELEGKGLHGLSPIAIFTNFEQKWSQKVTNRYSIRYLLVGLSFTYHLGSSTSNSNEIVSLNSSIACER